MAQAHLGRAVTLPAMWGREQAMRDLVGAHGRDALPHALLFHGPAGVGKQRLALWVGQLVLCEEPGGRGPCGSCRSCRMVLRLEHPDLHWFFPLPRPRRVSGPERLAVALEDARAETLASVRRQPLRPTYNDEPVGLYFAAVRTLRRMAHRRPSMGASQVFVVGDAQELVSQEASPEAANALLKLLEEPPEGTMFVLTSSEPGRLLPTIRSRSFPFHLGPIPTESVERFLAEVAGRKPAEAAEAAAKSQGSVGRALGYLPGDDGAAGPLEKIRLDALGLLTAGVEGSHAAAFAAGSRYSSGGARGLLDLFGALEDWLRDLAAVAAGAQALNEDRRDELHEAVRGRGIHPVGAARAVDAVEQAKFLASGNVNPQLLVHGLVREVAMALGTDA